MQRTSDIKDIYLIKTTTPQIIMQIHIIVIEIPAINPETKEYLF